MYLHVRSITASGSSMILPSELRTRPGALISVSSIVLKNGSPFMQPFVTSPTFTSNGTLKMVCVKTGLSKASLNDDVEEEENRMTGLLI